MLAMAWMVLALPALMMLLAMLPASTYLCRRC
jgi:hypothetical protein